ncbi:HAD family hydrolase [Phormidium sp. CLA17]|uniref:HAD family hydrolase n=1 Tax=Leptolyngbya sp. Cla-17 TaxID=2803751 RepID=UPI0014928510|nr:HAD family hydrolase [Leptolyngbya sp. Cla-17]MBM0741253.1 HAD family hydrolase [Leptolyngbya sp. Cla-17]
MIATPTVLALDFDGVLCDGLREYFKTAWQAYCNLWQPTSLVPPDGLAASFYRLRPVVETGWEMPLLLHALLQGVSEAAVLHDWVAIAQRLVITEQLDPAMLIAEVDGTRDQWIASDVNSWLAEHRFYPGVCDRLKATLDSDTQVAIISTKEGRFIQQLLEQQGIDLTDLQLFGKEVKRPKSEILLELMQVFGNDATFWFVEDRFKTLQSIAKKPELDTVQLFLANWGYNTSREREQAANDSRIRLISLDQFTLDFARWL